MNSEAMYMETCILSMIDERIKLLTLIKKEKKKRKKFKCARGLHIIFILCELKWHHALSHFIEHFLCIRRENKPTYTSCAKTRKKLSVAHKLGPDTCIYRDGPLVLVGISNRN
jgi:hypothetical protein